MAGSFSDYTENSVLDLIFGNTAFVPSGTLHFALSVTDFGDDGTSGDEPPAASGYSRAAATNNKTTFSNASGGSLDNDVDIQWVEASDDWGIMAYLGIFGQASGGPFYGGGDLTVTKTILSGDTAKVSAGNLTVTLS